MFCGDVEEGLIMTGGVKVDFTEEMAFEQGF